MEGQDYAAQEQEWVPLHVINRGFSRQDASPLIAPGEPHYRDASDMLLAILASNINPWETLQWWESPWQARIGVEYLARWPFLRLRRSDLDQHDVLVPTRLLYPYALRSSQKDRMERTAYTVAAAVRQAREMYTAAQSTGVTDLGRPLLYFYGALGLAKAATALLFGADALEEAHGLGTGYAPTISHDTPDWPTLIEWHGKGQFAMLYRAVRWDELYACCYRESRWQGHPRLQQPLRFHVLECIRALQYPWGTLPPTGLPAPGTALFNAQARPGLLLPYHGPSDMYQTSETPHTASLVQLPRVLVQYMLLYYFSILARYRPVEWRRLLAADHESEGYVFRAAMEQVAQDYVREIMHLLPNTPPPWTFAPESWGAERPTLDGWYVPPTELVGAPPGPRVNVYTLQEWDGEPQDQCTKATRLVHTLPEDRA